MQHGAVEDEVLGVLRDVLDRGGATWQACADAGLLGLVAPEAYDGAGLGIDAVAAMLRELGARAVDLPIAGTIATGLLALVNHGTEQQQRDLIVPVVSGDLLLIPALNERGSALPAAPTVRLSAAKGAWRLDGVKVMVDMPPGPARLLVSASAPDGSQCVVMIDSSAAGVSPKPTPSSAGMPESSITFTDVVVGADDVLGGAPGSAQAATAAEAVRAQTRGALLATGAGLVAGALAMTADYVKQREQFGRPLAAFQAVAMQVADVFVTSRMLDVGVRQVVWRLGEGIDAADDAAIAAYWLCEHGPAALQTCHHLHGGMGVDETYPLHRYFSRLKDVVRRLGGVDQTLAEVPLVATAAEHAELTEAQREFKARVRAYFQGLVSREDRLSLMTDRHGEAYHRAIKQMGTDGWMGVGWPTEYGGHGLGPIEQQIFANEAARNDIHLPSVTLQTVGPTLQAFGSQKQKDLFLPRILAGDVHFAIGYSEPDAGTDLAALRCAARQEPDGTWVVNGQKLWTTGGHAADYIWLAVRTDPDAPRHRGISVMIVDTRDPGYSWTPIITCDGSHHVNATYFNDVRVPADMVVGEVNQGWKLITTQLNHERVMLGPAGRLEGLRDMVAAWAPPEVVARDDVRELLARTTAAFRLNELLNWEVATGDSSLNAVADASASKVFASDVVQRIGLDLEAVVARYGDATDPETAYLLDYLDKTSKRNLVLTFGGGVNEVQRELICQFGLGLPRVPR